jgi:ribosomal protein L11 methyltransferase
MLEGLPPHRPSRVMRLATTERAARATTDLIGEVFDPAETAVAAFETENGEWLLEAYFATDPDEDVIRDLIRPIVGDVADTATFDALAAQDWVRNSLEGLKPVRAGRFLVYGGHDRETVKVNDHAIEIEAALAFGTGHHGTTRGCLLFLDAVLKQGRPARILDVGTGTGVLAFAAAKALKTRIDAGDIDPIAIDVARENARLNGVSPWLSTYVGAGLTHASIRGQRFDLIMANILARPLTRLAPSLVKALAPGGSVILSGLLHRDVPGILTAYRAQGLALVSERRLDEWSALLLRRGGAAPRPQRWYWY